MNSKSTPEAVLTHQERRAMLIQKMQTTETIGDDRFNWPLLMLILGMLVGLAINAG